MAVRIDPELPWGYWLRIEKRGGSSVYVDDDTGATWPTLRAAFWNGRLGMADPDAEPPADILELVHAVLAATMRRSPSRREQVVDLFDGSELFSRMFHVWLRSTGLMTLQTGGQGAGPLRHEGISVLQMLAATRPYDVRQHRPSAVTIGLLSELGLGPENQSTRFDRLEREAARWDAAFLRRDEAPRPTVILSKRATGPVPVLQTVWTLSFDDARQRECFYEWLCLRLDRWQAWSDLASDYGSEKLTHKLLAVMAASLAENTAGQVPPKSLSN